MLVLRQQNCDLVACPKIILVVRVVHLKKMRTVPLKMVSIASDRNLSCLQTSTKSKKMYLYCLPCVNLCLLNNAKVWNNKGGWVCFLFNYYAYMYILFIFSYQKHIISAMTFWKESIHARLCMSVRLCISLVNLGQCAHKYLKNNII